MITVESRKDKILNTALKLFSKQGFNATSTRMISKEAQVSESLIFRHFENKEGLLKAIIEKGTQEAFDAYATVLKLEHPKVIIKQIMSLPFAISKDQYNFWKLLYGLRWHTEVNSKKILLPIKEKLINTFKVLEYPDPESEAVGALLVFDGLMSMLLLKEHSISNAFTIFDTVMKRYDI